MFDFKHPVTREWDKLYLRQIARNVAHPFGTSFAVLMLTIAVLAFQIVPFYVPYCRVRPLSEHPEIVNPANF